GLLDYPYSSLYAQSKQAMISTANAYRTALVSYGIDVLIIAPGYINTAMLRSLNQGDASHKPFIISEDKAINYILAAIEKRVPLTIFPRPMKYMIKGLSLLPKSVLGWLMLKKLDKPTIPANKSD
ncbi:SDR family NAD(P)-dependent oxidoreductase, partial [Rhizobium hidalgonense]